MISNDNQPRERTVSYHWKGHNKQLHIRWAISCIKDCESTDLEGLCEEESCGRVRKRSSDQKSESGVGDKIRVVTGPLRCRLKQDEQRYAAVHTGPERRGVTTREDNHNIPSREDLNQDDITSDKDYILN